MGYSFKVRKIGFLPHCALYKTVENQTDYIFKQWEEKLMKLDDVIPVVISNFRDARAKRKLEHKMSC